MGGEGRSVPRLDRFENTSSDGFVLAAIACSRGLLPAVVVEAHAQADQNSELTCY